MNKDQYDIFDILEEKTDLEESCLKMERAFKNKGVDAKITIIDNQMVALELLQPCNLATRHPIEGQFLKEQPNLKALWWNINPHYKITWMVKND